MGIVQLAAQVLGMLRAGRGSHRETGVVIQFTREVAIVLALASISGIGPGTGSVREMHSFQGR